MPYTNKIIDALNEIRASEQRMALVYRRAAQMVTGPWREALVKEFRDHAEDEDRHAEIAMRHIVALGGDLTEEIKEIPVWHNLDELLDGLDELEEKGIKKWQSIMKLLDMDDAFRHTIESVLDREQEHYDEVKLWRRKDYADMGKSISDLGSPKPLNWKTPEFASQDIQKSTWDSRIEQHNRFGTPPTRRGGYHGQASGLQPGVPAEMNPPLTVSKALLAPPKIENGQVSAQKPRKRDPGGKFATNQSAGKQSAAQEDSVDRQRQAKLSSARQKTALNPEWAGKTRMGMTNKPVGKALGPDESMPPQDPAKSPGDPMANERYSQAGGQQLGRSPSGMPIYDDPYHPEHEGFSQEDHNAAAEMHDRKSVDAQDRGNHVEAIMCQQKAGIHRNMAADSQIPMERVIQNLAGPQQQGMPQSIQRSLPGAGDEMNPMDKFLSAQHQEDQGKPVFGDRFSAGPQPGKIDNRTQDPVGPQTAQMPHAGTQGMPQMMPPPPPAQNGSMPEIGGNQGTVVGQPMAPNPMMPPPPMQPGGMNQMMPQPMGPPMINTSLLDQLLQKPAPAQPMMQNQMQAQPQMQPPQMSQSAPQMQQSQGQPAAGPMDESGEEMQEQDEPVSTAPFGGDPKEEKSNQETQSNATKSLRAWLAKRR